VSKARLIDGAVAHIFNAIALADVDL